MSEPIEPIVPSESAEETESIQGDDTVETDEEVEAVENQTLPIDMDHLTLEGETAADYLEELLDIADLDGDIDTYVEAGRPHVSILTQGDQLVGSQGEVLEALQDLSRLAVLTKLHSHSRLILDIAGHRDKRRGEIAETVNAAIAELRASGEPISLQAMNPFERKIVHDTVAAEGLYSESEGVGPNRHVVIRMSE